MEKLDLAGEGGTDFRPAFAYIDELIATHRFTELKGVIYFTDGQGIYPQKMPLYQTAFVFMDDGAEEQEVPPWAMKLVLDEEDLRGVRNRRILNAQNRKSRIRRPRIWQRMSLGLTRSRPSASALCC